MIAIIVPIHCPAFQTAVRSGSCALQWVSVNLVELKLFRGLIGMRMSSPDTIYSCSECNCRSSPELYHSVPLIDWISDTLSQGYTDLQSLVKLYHSVQ